MSPFPHVLVLSVMTSFITSTTPRVPITRIIHLHKPKTLPCHCTTMADHKDHPPPPPPPPHPHSFFKVFIGVDGPSPAHPFVVPPSYVKAVGGALPDKYTLQGPDGDLTLVQVKKNGFHWFFRGGWGPFIKDYSLKFGDFLFFTLDHISTAAAAAAAATTTQKLHFQVYGINGYLKMIGNSTSAHSFYKIFTGQAQDNFRVPPPYVNAIGGVLLDKYMLRGPNGEYRIVEVERDGGFWFFKGGWGDSFGWVSARLVEELDSIRCDPKYGTLLDLYLGYGAYEDEGLEECSMNGISSSAADSQYDTCNESNDEEVVVSCKRASEFVTVMFFFSQCIDKF
ncbi:hypothetical protein Sjap_010157 [Stephania japonica]|uniref:TF-B3 domain-containing protein n=1 Tax=Stephania japonica TaxID=461633 RepID=A0AAP0P649_9MAGN